MALVLTPKYLDFAVFEDIVETEAGSASGTLQKSHFRHMIFWGLTNMKINFQKASLV